MHRGYVKQWRKEIESEVWDRPPLYYKVWRYLLMAADYKTGTLKRSGPQIAEAVQWEDNNAPVIPDRKTIGRVLEWMQGAGMLVTKISGHSSRRFYEITICNWRTYQVVTMGLVTENPEDLSRGTPPGRLVTDTSGNLSPRPCDATPCNYEGYQPPLSRLVTENPETCHEERPPLEALLEEPGEKRESARGGEKPGAVAPYSRSKVAASEESIAARHAAILQTPHGPWIQRVTDHFQQLHPAPYKRTPAKDVEDMEQVEEVLRIDMQDAPNCHDRLGAILRFAVEHKYWVRRLRALRLLRRKQQGGMVWEAIESDMPDAIQPANAVRKREYVTDRVPDGPLGYRKICDA